MKTITSILILAGILACMFVCWRVSRTQERIEYLPADTVIIRDTIRDTVLKQHRVYIARVDTAYLTIPGDTVRVEVEVPIERREYSTSDYRAIVEGYRASLVSMEVYRQTVTITKPEIRYGPVRPRWGLGIQVGYGIPINGRPAPYIGLGVQYNFITW